jgi:hypothetical protein
MTGVDDNLPKSRWFHLKPDRLIPALLAVEGLLWLSDRIGWPVWQKGHAVLTTVTAVGVALFLMLIWFALVLVFRWRFQFTVRSLVVLVVLVAIPCSWLAVEREQAGKQHDAVEAIRKAHWTVFYDYELLRPMPEPKGHVWLRELLGDDFFNTVSYAGISCDTQAKYLEEFPQLQHLTLYGTVTDDGLEYVEGLTQLQEVRIIGVQVTHVGVLKLQMALPNCEIHH